MDLDRSDNRLGSTNRHLLDDVQGRIEEYCLTLFEDMHFDRSVAQKAEHAMLEVIASKDHGKLTERELRLNAHAIGKFRRRTHDQLCRLAEVVRAAKSTQKQINAKVAVSFGGRDWSDEELQEAFGVLEESGLVPEGVFEEDEAC